MRLLRRRPSPALVVSIVAVIAAGGGSAVAAGLITSRQIKNGTIQRADLSQRVRSDLSKRGPRGPQGADGPAGPAGIGKSYFVRRIASGIALGPEMSDVVGLSGLAAGSYIIEGRAAAVNFTPEQFVRCVLRAGNTEFAPSVAHVANDTSEAETIAPVGTFSSSTPFDVAMRCRHDNPPAGPYLDHIALWAIRVADLDVRTTP
jgi:hypothetical protein